MHPIRLFAIATMGGLAITGCSSSDSETPAGSSDSGVADTSAQDTSTIDVVVQDGPIPGDFVVRKPELRSLDCPNVASSTPDAGPVASTLSDTDWVCSFDYDGTKGEIYIQSTPTKCEYGYETMPTVYAHPVQQLKVNGMLYPLTNASYNYGGNHHNDFLEFDYKDKHFKYYHSSFGFGWRSCQNMDCGIVQTSGASDVILDGCTKERKLPIVCSLVSADGTYAPLTDKFAPCPGDPNYP